MYSVDVGIWCFINYNYGFSGYSTVGLKMPNTRIVETLRNISIDGSRITLKIIAILMKRSPTQFIGALLLSFFNDFYYLCFRDIQRFFFIWYFFFFFGSSFPYNSSFQSNSGNTSQTDLWDSLHLFQFCVFNIIYACKMMVL